MNNLYFRSVSPRTFLIVTNYKTISWTLYLRIFRQGYDRYYYRAWTL